MLITWVYVVFSRLLLLYTGKYPSNVSFFSEKYFLLCLVENPTLNFYGHDKILETAVNDIKQVK